MQLLRELMEAVEAFHMQGWVHGSLSPSALHLLYDGSRWRLRNGQWGMSTLLGSMTPEKGERPFLPATVTN